jgi:hypothetical protein
MNLVSHDMNQLHKSLLEKLKFLQSQLEHKSLAFCGISSFFAVLKRIRHPGPYPKPADSIPQHHIIYFLMSILIKVTSCE